MGCNVHVVPRVSGVQRLSFVFPTANFLLPMTLYSPFMRTFNAPVGTDKVRNGLAVPQIGFVMFVYLHALHTFLAISFMAGHVLMTEPTCSANIGLYCITCCLVTLCHIGRITFLPFSLCDE